MDFIKCILISFVYGQKRIRLLNIIIMMMLISKDKLNK